MKRSILERISVLSILVILLMGCNLENKRVEGHYVAKNNDFLSFLRQSITVRSFLKNENNVPVLDGNSFIDFFRNGTYVMNLHHFEYGAYELEDDTIKLTSSEGIEWGLLFIKDTVNNSIVFKHLNVTNSNAVFDMERLPNDNDSDYPYTLENNRWRIKATKDESTNQIIDRLQNHIEYMEKYLTWCRENSIEVDIKKIPSILKVAGNVIGIKNPAETGWCQFFHSQENCDESRKLVAKFFKGDKLKWKRYKSRIKIMVNAMSQLREDLDNYRTD